MMQQPTMSYAQPQMQYAMPQQQQQQQPVERQVYTEQVSVPRTYTQMVPQTSMQNRTIQVPVQTPIQVPVNSTVQVPIQSQVPYQEAYTTYEEQTIQVPRMVMDTKTVQVPKTAYETKYRTVTNYQTQQVTNYETQMQTSYTNQTIQEPVQVMVPQTQTVNTIQNINKVVEYARVPVNQYTVPGPSYTQPVQQQMSYAQPQQMSYAQPTMSYAQPQQMSYAQPSMSYGQQMPYAQPQQMP